MAHASRDGGGISRVQTATAGLEKCSKRPCFPENRPDDDDPVRRNKPPAP